ncbi:hypothetical protein LIER_26916 [Lithospermum erythrorhizon]|uniref:Uncharacterized protein n=1 Tax=Lithospermum erythrorhizon TaxID=34254 RepID=A0AAV3RC56_LITER
MACKAVRMGHPISKLHDESSRSTTVNCALIVDTLVLLPTIKSSMTAPKACILCLVNPVNSMWSGCIKLRGSRSLSKVLRYKISAELPVSMSILFTMKFAMIGAITTGSSWGNSIPTTSLSE